MGPIENDGGDGWGNLAVEWSLPEVRGYWQDADTGDLF